VWCPVKAANDNQKDESITRACLFWGQRLGRDLSGEDARQIVENVSGFFAVLADWSRSEQANPANDNGSADASTKAASKKSTPAAREGASDHD
jgi:hypothetical protein